jgi:hypothetical protein
MFNVTIFDGDNQMLYFFNNTVGPRVTMDGATNPESFEFEKTNSKNGGLSNYTFTIIPNNNIQEGDKIKLTMADPIQFTQETRIEGYDLLYPELERIISEDLRSVEIVVKLKDQRRRNLQSEQLNSLRPTLPFKLTATQLTNPVSLRPYKGQIKYQVYTAEGDMIESTAPIKYNEDGEAIEGEITI